MAASRKLFSKAIPYAMFLAFGTFLVAKFQEEKLVQIDKKKNSMSLAEASDKKLEMEIELLV